MLNLFRRISMRPCTFSTTRDAVDYYQILELQSGATEDAIRKAYAELTENVKPQVDVSKFKALNEAFVILTDNKTRDAYDSLLAVKKSFYNSPNVTKEPATRSYLSTRKISKEEFLKKRANIDSFGRYKGGLPRRNSDVRGNSLGQTGTMYRQTDIEQELNPDPEFNVVSAEKAESFKDFHQDERKARTMKWPWFTFQVDYDYFTFRKFRTSYWPRVQLFIFLFYILPTLYYTVDRLQKKDARAELKVKAEEKARKLKEAQEAQETPAEKV